MTAFNTDYNDTELLDQELEAVVGGGRERAELARRLFTTSYDDWDEPERLAEWKAMHKKYLELA